MPQYTITNVPPVATPDPSMMTDIKAGPFNLHGI